jgi:hypothetical protein
LLCTRYDRPAQKASFYLPHQNLKYTCCSDSSSNQTHKKSRMFFFSFRLSCWLCSAKLKS